jgi:hypothetical protein
MRAGRGEPGFRKGRERYEARLILKRRDPLSRDFVPARPASAGHPPPQWGEGSDVIRLRPAAPSAQKYDFSTPRRRTSSVAQWNEPPNGP